MVKKFIVSKNTMHFELCIDGTIEVNPLPSEELSKESITVLAEVHQSFIDFYRIKGKHQDLVEVAVGYFANKGFKIKDKDEENTTPPPNRLTV